MISSKVILIIGASSDIGINLIKSISDKYSTIIAHYNSNSDCFDALNKEIRGKMMLYKADISKEDEIERLIIDINNKGVIPDHIVFLAAPVIQQKKFTKYTKEDYCYAFKSSFLACEEIVRAFIKNMAKKEHGKIVFMLSSCVLSKAPKNQTPYVMMKYSMLGLMKSLSSEYADRNIMVNAVSPDMIDTKYNSNISDLIIEKHRENSPIKRNLFVNDVVPTIEFLLSEGANTITGINVGVTGGNI